MRLCRNKKMCCLHGKWSGWSPVRVEFGGANPEVLAGNLAILWLGALHDLEPGHSKTMMAAFIISIRGTIAQAVLLGLSAAISHSLLIWLLVALALYYGSQWNAENREPYLQLVSAVLIFGLAVWMYRRTRREPGAHAHEAATPSGLILPAGFAPTPSLDTGHGWLEIAVFETGVPPRFRIHPCKTSGEPVALSKGTTMRIETTRMNGSSRSTFYSSLATDSGRRRRNCPSRMSSWPR